MRGYATQAAVKVLDQPPLPRQRLADLRGMLFGATQLMRSTLRSARHEHVERVRSEAKVKVERPPMSSLPMSSPRLQVWLPTAVE